MTLVESGLLSGADVVNPGRSLFGGKKVRFNDIL